MEIRPELNDIWFVRFGSQEDCMAACWWLRTKGKIKGKSVKCRVKSVLQSTTYNPGSHPTGSDSYPHPYRGGYTPQSFYPGYAPGPTSFNPMGMQYPKPGANAGYQGGQQPAPKGANQRGGRRNSGR